MGAKIPIHENDGIDVQLRAVAILRVTESGDGGFGGDGLRRAQSAQSDGENGDVDKHARLDRRVRSGKHTAHHGHEDQRHRVIKEPHSPILAGCLRA